MGKYMDRKDNFTENNHDHPNIPISPNVTQTSPLDLSINSKKFLFRQQSSTPVDLSTVPITANSRQMSIDYAFEFEPPEIITQPKQEWHYRSIKDLAKQHLPYLAGNGPQRTPIRVKIPQMIGEELFLGIAVYTINDDLHPSKVIVPAKTHVNKEILTHDNNLDCLQFDQCNVMDHFDANKRHIYSEITQAEYHVGYKEVRIHMFNLYQNQLITKDMIVAQQLNQCKLAFWLCARRNNEYIAVSETSFSLIIEEKKMTTKSRVPIQSNQPTLASIPYAAFYIDYNNNQDDMDEGDSY